MIEDKNKLPELPKGWVWTTVENILLQLESGVRPKGGVKNIKEGITSIGGEHLLMNGGFDFTKIRYIPREFYGKMTRGKVIKRDVLVVKDGATTGKTAFVADSFPFSKAAVNEHVFILRVLEEYIEPKYLFFWMQSIHGQNCVKENFQGTAQGGINSYFVKNSNFPLPPLPEQQRIVAKIEALFTGLDAGVEALKKAKAQLKRYRQAVLKHAFEGKLTEEWCKAHKNELEPAPILLERIREERKRDAKDKGGRRVIARSGSDEAISKDGIASPSARNDSLPKLPEGWVWTFLPNLGELNRGKSKHRPRDDKKLFGGKYPFIQTGDVRNSNGLIKNYAQTYNEYGLKQSRLWPENTLCITIAANIAETAILGISACFPDSIVGFVADNRICEVKYVCFFIKTIKDKLESYAPATAQKNINLNTLSNIIIPLPPLSEQHKIVEEIERRLSVADEVEKTVEQGLKQADRLRQSILKRAFQGKLVPQDPSDEPAGVLLERIRFQRQQTEKDIKPRRKKASG